MTKNYRLAARVCLQQRCTAVMTRKHK